MMDGSGSGGGNGLSQGQGQEIVQEVVQGEWKGEIEGKGEWEGQGEYEEYQISSGQLGEGWCEYYSPEGWVYYFNEYTQAVQWERPLMEDYTGETRREGGEGGSGGWDGRDGVQEGKVESPSLPLTFTEIY